MQQSALGAQALGRKKGPACAGPFRATGGSLLLLGFFGRSGGFFSGRSGSVGGRSSGVGRSGSGVSRSSSGVSGRGSGVGGRSSGVSGRGFDSSGFSGRSGLGGRSLFLLAGGQGEGSGNQGNVQLGVHENLQEVGGETSCKTLTPYAIQDRVSPIHKWRRGKEKPLAN